jgi:hypothetical protein
VKIAALFKSRSKSKGNVPSKVRYPFGLDAIQIFVGALEGAAPVLTAEDKNSPFLLYKELGIASLLSQFADFIVGRNRSAILKRKTGPSRNRRIPNQEAVQEVLKRDNEEANSAQRKR